MKATFEQLLNGEVSDVSIVGSAMVDFVVGLRSRAEGRERARHCAAAMTTRGTGMRG